MVAQAVNSSETNIEDTDKPAPMPFTVGYERNNSEAIVFGCLIFGVLFLIVGVVGKVPLLAIAGIAPLATAYWHFPMIDKGRPQLGANEDGLYVERIGFIDWGAIRMAEINRSKARNIDQVKLNVLLTRPITDAVSKAQQTPLWKKFMMRNWKRSPREHGRELVAINLHTLAADPDEILNRIRAFKFI